MGKGGICELMKKVFERWWKGGLKNDGKILYELYGGMDFSLPKRAYTPTPIYYLAYI